MLVKRFSQKDHDKAVNLYVETNLSAQQIADEVGCSRVSVYSWIKEANIDLRFGNSKNYWAKVKGKLATLSS